MSNLAAIHDYLDKHSPDKVIIEMYWKDWNNHRRNTAVIYQCSCGKEFYSKFGDSNEIEVLGASFTPEYITAACSKSKALKQHIKKKMPQFQFTNLKEALVNWTFDKKYKYEGDDND